MLPHRQAGSVSAPRKDRGDAHVPQPDGVHTFPVPRGWSAEQAWHAICRGDLLTDPHPFWANVVVEDGRVVEFGRFEWSDVEGLAEDGAPL